MAPQAAGDGMTESSNVVPFPLQLRIVPAQAVDQPPAPILSAADALLV